MNQPPPRQLLDPGRREALKAAARARAVELRAEAHRDVWDALGRVLKRAWAAVRPRTQVRAHARAHA